MKLYELSTTFADLFDQFDEINSYTPDTDADGNYINDDGEVITDLEALRESYRQAWFDTLTAIEGEFDTKAENIAVYIKNMTAEVKALKAEEDALRLRRKAFEKSVELFRLKQRYNYHKVFALRLLDLKERYSAGNIRMISNLMRTSTGTPEQYWQRLLWQGQPDCQWQQLLPYR